MNTTNKASSERKLLDSQISLEQIRLLYGSLKFSLGASFAVAVIMYITLINQSDSSVNLDIWACSVLTVFAIRTLDALHFIYSSADKQKRVYWHARFLTGALAGGILWGSLSWLGHSSKDEYQALIVMCTVGVCAGSLSSLAFSWRALVIFFTPATTLLAVNLFISEGRFSHMTAIILAFFILFTLMSGKRIFNNTYQNIRLRIEADNRENALELMHQKQLLHSQQTPLAVIEFDLKLHITDWNKAAEDIFGYKKSEAIGNNILSLIVPTSSMSQVEDIWNGVLNLSPVVGDAVENHTKDGSSIVCEWYITPLTKGNKEIVGVAAMALDVTDKKCFEKELVSARDESDRANQAKSDFLSNMSHELRTPLNAILGFTQLLNIKTTLDERQKAYVRDIDSAGQLQLELVNHILDLASIEEGHLFLSIEKVSVNDVVNECKTLISPLAEKNKISIVCDDARDIYVNADYTRLKQIILNLLTNAIKYNNENGSVHINCTHSSHRLRINVVDTGKSVPKDFHEDIFTPFNRSGVGNTIEGTGIGLSISKHLIEKMGGTIGVSNNEDIGSTFWIELDSCDVTNNNENVRADIVTSKHPTPSNNYIGAKQIKILVAEDNPINQTLLMSQLDSLGYTADLVSNGHEALDLLEKEHYDLLFTDCNMPEMDGYELARTIRNNGNEKLSIFAITADAFPEKESQCLAAGMNARITKPVSLDTLNDVINKEFS